MKILLVEDEPRMSEALCAILRQEKYDVEAYPDGISGCDAAVSGIHDLLILDVMLPGMNGFAIAKEARRAGIKAPILMLTARADLDDKVTGLDNGADDYLTKPFETRELLARIRAMLRRNNIQSMDENGQLTYGDLRLNLNTSMLCNTVNLQEVRLSEKELRIMEVFLTNHGNIVNKEQLAVKIWGYENEAEYNNVEVYISFTRRKLQFLNSTMEIKAVRGLGYELRKVRSKGRSWQII